MRRKIWLALALAAVLAVSFAASSVAAKGSASDPRPKKVTKGLDYLHARQEENGGFYSMANTAWGILGLVASGERPGYGAWTINKTNAFKYLEANNHQTAAVGSDVDNAPVYYARAIMAYVAAGQGGRVPIAGTPQTNLLAKLYSYQDQADASPTRGAFSPETTAHTYQAVITTAWAILGLNSFGERGKDNFVLATTWLATQQNSDGGFPSQEGNSSSVVATALAAQALELADPVPTDVITAARQYLKDMQRANGGFPLSAGASTIDAQATAAAIQAIIAMGETQGSWAVDGKTPADALGTLQRKNGAYKKRPNSNAVPFATTSWALIALRNQPFTTFPKSRPTALKAFVAKPVMKTVLPKNHTKYTKTRVVLIRATYRDGRGGTGVKASACRVYIDGVNRSKAASIGAYGLHLVLKNVPDGQHTVRLLIRDNAGNVRVVQREFTVAMPAPPPSSSSSSSSSTSSSSSSYVPPYTPSYTTPTYHSTPASTPTPSTTLYPTPSSSLTPSYSPYPSASGAPVTGSTVASPSPSASPGATGVGVGGGGGSAAGFVGGTLLAMLPVGAVISYLIFQRREQALDPAVEGNVLGGGGSAWDRTKATLGRAKNLVKPAGS
jgi:hypothetical protein